MWIQTNHNPNGRLKTPATNHEWVEFSNGTAQVKKEIGEALIAEYEHVTETNS